MERQTHGKHQKVVENCEIFKADKSANPNEQFSVTNKVVGQIQIRAFFA